MRIFTIIFLFCLTQTLRAQDGESLDALFNTKYDSPLTLELAETEEVEEIGTEKKEKKTNPKIYYGIKTKRGFAKSGFGDRTVVELFYYLKEFEGPSKYTSDFYWYDFKKKKIVNSTKVTPGYAGVLHGHYVKKMGDQILEEGYFYKGMKHGRWVRFNRFDILQDKEYYWKGWPRESMLSYYDFKKTQLKEVIPVHYGEKHGDYYAFHQSGSIAVTGKFQYDNKIGLWREYYENRRVKREIAYPEEPFDFKTPPLIMKEWDENGKVIFDRRKAETSRR